MTDANLNADLVIEPDPEWRRKLLDNQRAKMGVGRRREGTHVSDLIFCTRKAWAERHSDFVLEPSDSTILTWMRGLSHEDLAAQGLTQVRVGYCFECDEIVPWDSQIEDAYDEEHDAFPCPRCGDSLMVGTVDWVELDGVTDYVPVEMKSTLKSSRKTLDDMAWYADQCKTYMAIHRRDIGRIGRLHIMGDYRRTNPDERDSGPNVEFHADKLQWRDENAAKNWLATLKRRKEKLEDPTQMPPLDEDSPGRHPMICGFCVIGERLPNGQECERWPYRKLADGTYVKKDSPKRDMSMDEMMQELQTLDDRGGN